MAFEFLKTLFQGNIKEKQLEQNNLEDIFKMLAAEAAKNIKISSDETKEEEASSLAKVDKNEEEELVSLDIADEEEEFFI